MTAEMRVLTVRQPWAWAIIHGGKDVENRVRNIAGDYRGPVAIHAGLSEDRAGFTPRMDELWAERHGRTPYPPAVPTQHRDQSIYLEFGAIIGVVDLIAVHIADECLSRVRSSNWEDDPDFETCSTWAEGADRDTVHLVLGNPRPLRTAIPFKGALGLRRLDATTIDLITKELP